MVNVKEHMRQPVTGYGLAVVLILCISLTIASLAVSYVARRNTELKFCSSVASSTATEQRKLDAYRREPPPTPAGKAQMREVEVSLRSWSELGRRLGCPPSEKEKR